MPARRRPRESHDDPVGGGERLQKVLAAAGIGSRRECEEYIVSGRVDIDGQTVTELGSKVDPTRQQIRVDGTLLPQPKRTYYVVNKPTGVVCTNSDPAGRMRVIDLVPDDERLFTVGRLDRGSEGLILVTNDGELANRLTHPRYGVDKVYRVRVAGQPTPQALARLRRGVQLDDGLARVAAIQVKRRHKQSTDLEIVLNEGRNREIRRILARIGHKVVSLKRIAMGPLRLGELPTGAFRKLSRQEVKQLAGASEGQRKRTAASSGASTGKPAGARRKKAMHARKTSGKTGGKTSEKKAQARPAAKKKSGKPPRKKKRTGQKAVRRRR